MLLALICFGIMFAENNSTENVKLQEKVSATSSFDPPTNIWDMKEYTLDGEECTMYVFLYEDENGISEFREFPYYVEGPNYYFQYWYTFTEIGCQLCEGGSCSPQGCGY